MVRTIHPHFAHPSTTSHTVDSLRSGTTLCEVHGRSAWAIRLGDAAGDAASGQPGDRQPGGPGGATHLGQRGPDLLEPDHRTDQVLGPQRS